MRRSKRGAERSCLVCHRRKVRCDKGLPCGNCTRAGVLCCYPSGDKTTRQPKATIADIASRLVQLERTLVAVSRGAGDADVSSESTPRAEAEVLLSLDQRPSGSQSRTQIADEDTGSSASEEILLKNSFRYINEILLSRVLEEEKEIQLMLASPKDPEAGSRDDDDSPAQGLAPALGLFWSPGPNRPLGNESLQPPKAQANRLWQLYKQNVEPMDKLLHVPTTEIQVYTAINGAERPNDALSCLLFSIYFAAATSCLPEDYRTVFGEDKHVAMDRFQAGLEYSLARSNFLEAPTVFGLQALTLFLRLTRARSPGRSAWIMHGTVLRAAQSIGFHRDGDNFGLSPFESEMRRRIWWHLFCHDARAAEDHGIAIDVLGGHGSDIRFPLNINDSDMDPAMTELPPARPGWTDMTLPVCMYRLTQMMRRLYELTTAGSGPGTEERRCELVREHTAYVEALLRQCNPVVPVQRLTIQMVRMVQLKNDLVSQLQLLTATRTKAAGLSRTPHATEASLLGACQIIELSQDIQADELMQHMLWASDIYPQYHVLLYLLWHLCVRPVSAGNNNIGRAWAAVDAAFASEVGRQQRQRIGGGTASANPKWAVLKALRDKAMRIREATQKGGGGGAADSDSTTATGTAGTRAPSTQTAPPAFLLSDVEMTPLFGDSTTNETTTNWDSNFLDWNVLADDFRSDTFDFAFCETEGFIA